MFANSDELLKYVKDEGVEMVDVRFCDLPGVMQHFTVSVSSFDQSVFDDGLNFDGSSIRGFQAIHESDMSLFPDPTTAYIDPFRSAKTLVVNFFIHDPITGEAYSRDPRNIAPCCCATASQGRCRSLRPRTSCSGSHATKSVPGSAERFRSRKRPGEREAAVSTPARRWGDETAPCFVPRRSSEPSSGPPTCSLLGCDPGARAGWESSPKWSRSNYSNFPDESVEIT